MARNRKHQAAAVRFAPAVKAFLLCAFVASAGVGYVWQKQQINELGRQILDCETKLKKLGDEGEKQRRQLATLQSPQHIEFRIRELNLGLVPPPVEQIWRLAEPSGDTVTSAPAAGNGERKYAARRTARQAMP